jgi:hypothetical protein
VPSGLLLQAPPSSARTMALVIALLFMKLSCGVRPCDQR